MGRINKEIKRFIFVGITSVFIDLLFYTILVNLNFLIFFSKGISFFLGALFSYIANKKITFNAKGGKKVFSKFIFIYMISLFLNVFLNSNIINILNILNIKSSISLTISFIASTFFSAYFNFIGLKKFVFQEHLN